MGEDEIHQAMARARAPGPPRLELLGGTPRATVVGLVPGSFDPMTVAHAALAEALGADLTLLLYSSATLPKEPGPGGRSEPPLIGQEERVASMAAFARARPRVAVALSSHGLLADQAESAAEAFPESRLVFGVGSDKVAQILDPNWYEDRDGALRRLFSRADVAYAVRLGDEERLRAALAEAGAWGPRFRRLDLDPRVASVSSRSVRAALRRGEDVAAAVPAEVFPFLPKPAGSSP